MHFPKLAAIMGTLAAAALAIPTPDPPPTARALPQIRLCKDAQYGNCIDQDITLGTCRKFAPAKAGIQPLVLLFSRGDNVYTYFSANILMPDAEDLDGSWNDAVSSIDFHTPEVGTCDFYQ